MSPSLNCSGLSAFPEHVSEFMGPAKSERHSTRSASSAVRKGHRCCRRPVTSPPADDSIPVKALPAPEGADKDQATVTASEPDAGTATEAEASLGRAGEGAAGTRSDAAIQPDR